MLNQDDFPEPILVVQEQGGFLENHAHPFEVKALVLEGSIDIMVDGFSTRYKTGDIFQLQYKQPHSESYGPSGVKYLASRRQ